MRPLTRSLAPLLLAGGLTACQPAVRPNLATEVAPVDGLSAAAQASAGGASPASSGQPPGQAGETVPPASPGSDPDSVAAIDPVSGVGADPSGPTTPLLTRGADVFARINSGLASKTCEGGSNADRWRQRYASNPAALARRLETVLPLLDFVSAEVERARLPAEFVFIPLVESWYRPEAIGSNGPAGMWQMIGSTARNHGVHIKPGYDGRLSPVESTRAALSYLKTLEGSFDGWQAIVMAYNAGEGRLAGAFRRAKSRNASAAERKPHGLSNITYDYVAKLQALACLVNEPERSRLQLPMEARFMPLAPVLMDKDLHSLEQFAASRGQDARELRRLNPGYKNGRVVAGVPRLVLTPFGVRQTPVGQTPLVEVEVVGDGLRARRTHRVNSGESLWSIARLYSLTVDSLRRFNRLGRGGTLRPGQMLKLVP